MDDFRIYNNCLIPNRLPDDIVDTNSLKYEVKKNKVYLARWTTDFDIKMQTEWWYLIKDDIYSKDTLKSKYRYEINKGLKNFDIKVVNMQDFKEELYNINSIANKEYSKLSNTLIDKEQFFEGLKTDKNTECIIAVDKLDKTVSAYAICIIRENVVNFSVLKSLPYKKKLGVNAAIVDFICNKYLNQEKYRYIYDGERSIRHITNFQDYLIKYFGFRKAYCKLHIEYANKIKFLVYILYPFRNIIGKFSKLNKAVYNLYCILCQEEIHRTFK